MMLCDCLNSVRSMLPFYRSLPLFQVSPPLLYLFAIDYNTKAASAITDIHPDDALLMVLPMAHNFPLACPGMQGFLQHGARVILGSSMRPNDIFALIEKERITHLEFVPTLLIHCTTHLG